MFTLCHYTCITSYLTGRSVFYEFNRLNIYISMLELVIYQLLWHNNIHYLFYINKSIYASQWQACFNNNTSDNYKNKYCFQYIINNCYIVASFLIMSIITRVSDIYDYRGSSPIITSQFVAIAKTIVIQLSYQ